MLKSGDVVKLKGTLSPRMTVDHIVDNTKAMVLWFNFSNLSNSENTDVSSYLNAQVISVDALELVIE